MAKLQSKRAKLTSQDSRNTRLATAKQIAKKRSKAQRRITKDQVADLSAQINNDFAGIQTFYTQSTPGYPESGPALLLPEKSVHELADVMKEL
ncbi:hypothetical protein C8Q76DRAFT_33093 [Earliella scabrosa]|nr:hypothetical protein C8Q76DRAFT_33093 [Earliella scabrosa]